MATNKKMAMVVHHVKMDEEDALDVKFWLSKTPVERLEEVSRLRNNYYIGTNGSFPQKMEKVVHHKKHDF